MIKTILLVEDEAIIGLNEKRRLESEGFNVIHVCDGETAIETVKHNPETIDLVLMDINLGPGIDGTFAAKEILKGYDIPLIFLSSHTEKEIVEKTEQITSYGYAVKDSDITVLLALIKMAFKLHNANKELKKNEEFLKERKFWLNESQRAARIGHYRLNILTGEWSNSEMVNEIFGVDEDFFIKQASWISLIHPEDKTGVMEYLGRCIVEQSPLKKEYRVIRPNDKKILWIHDIGRLTFDDLGNPVSLFGVIQDVTERRRVEDALNESERNFRQLSSELKISNETKDKFLSILAHDLRGPFTGFLGMTEDLAKNIDELKKEEIVEYANIMHSVSTRLFGLLTNLLEWSRLQTGRMEHRPCEFNLLPEMESAIELYSSAATSKSINIINIVDTKTKVYADINMVSGILRNLISNAVKFTSVGGEILTSAKELGSFTEISVSDNGVGMTEKEIEKIFSIDSGYTTRGTKGEKGSGLGLALCKEMVKMNGGEIRVKSVPGKGTSIYFTLPTAKG